MNKRGEMKRRKKAAMKRFSAH